MKMFFSRADAVSLWESERRLCQEAGLGALLGCPTAAPGDRATATSWGEGQWGSSGESCRRGG